MYKLTIENDLGGRLEFQDLYGPYQITEIEGLNPPTATINTTEMGLIDGVRYSSSKLAARTLNIAFAILYDVESNRLNAYKVLRAKRRVKVSYKNDHRDVCAYGYVEKVAVGYYDQTQIVTATILCPSAYWSAAQSVVSDMSVVNKTFHFPFGSTAAKEVVFGYIDPIASTDIANDGDVDTGMVIELYAREALSNPTVYDYTTKDYFGLDIDMQQADLITVDTRAGNKTAILTRNAKDTNVFYAIRKGSKWLQLPTGGGVYVYSVGSGEATALAVTITHDDQYEGV